MPTVAQILDDVRDDVLDPTVDSAGNPITPRYTNAMLLRKLNKAATTVARRTLCVKKTDSQATVVGQREYALPTDYIQLRSVMYRNDTGVDPLHLTEVPLDETFSLTSTEIVNGFARRGDAVLRLNGEPTIAVAGSGLVIDYFALPAEVTAASAPTFDIPERYRDAVQKGTTALTLAGMDEEPGKAQAAQLSFEVALQESVDREKEASHTSPGRVRDAYDPMTGNYYR